MAEHKKKSEPENEPLPQTPPPTHSAAPNAAADEAASGPAETTVPESLAAPVGSTTVEPVAGSDGPRSQQDLDALDH
jgi:hypothetical protein